MDGLYCGLLAFHFTEWKQCWLHTVCVISSLWVQPVLYCGLQKKKYHSPFWDRPTVVIVVCWVVCMVVLYPYRITGIYPTTLVVVVVVPGLGAICTTNTLLSFIRNHVQLVAQFVLWFVIFFCNSAFNTVLYWLTPGSKSCTIRPRPYSPPLPPISMLGVGVCK